MCIRDSIYITIILEIGLQKSPYNFDIQIRLIILYQMIGNFERMFKIFMTMDVKSVQYETIGFFFMKPALELNLEEQVTDQVSNAILYYSENYKESKMNVQTAIKKQKLEAIEEFISFDEWIECSYMKLLFYYIKLTEFLKGLLKKNQVSFDANSNYFLNYIADKLKNKNELSWNIDMHLMQPYSSYANKDCQFIDYLGLFNNPIYLHIQTNLLQIEGLLPNILEENYITKDIRVKLDKIHQLYQEWESCNLFDFSQLKSIGKKDYLLHQKQYKNFQQSQLQLLFEYELQIIQINNYLIEILCNINDISATDTQILSQTESLINQLLNLISKLVKKLIDSLEQYKEGSEFFPSISYKCLQNLTQSTYRIFNILKSKQEIFKQKIGKIAKKAGDLKKSLQNISKSIQNLSISISEEFTKLHSHSLIFLNKFNDVSDISIQKKVEMIFQGKIPNSKQQALFDIFSPLKKVDLLKLSKDYTESLQQNYKFLSINLRNHLKFVNKFIVIDEDNKN
eukprot:TRINITY_DN1965_c0_g2_i1.p1 TRINITY_DN1965_c0_g2~~TRINITY_DN1965_c0_g2_i1.p1  ORF type:complete len:511 (-),score=97.64 TRINITY_DN1965_c0_g2_i1:367-1899(-)